MAMDTMKSRLSLATLLSRRYDLELASYKQNSCTFSLLGWHDEVVMLASSFTRVAFPLTMLQRVVTLMEAIFMHVSMLTSSVFFLVHYMNVFEGFSLLLQTKSRDMNCVISFSMVKMLDGKASILQYDGY